MGVLRDIGFGSFDAVLPLALLQKDNPTLRHTRQWHGTGAGVGLDNTTRYVGTA